MDFVSSPRAAGNRTRWKEIVSKSSVMPCKVWDRIEKNYFFFQVKSKLQR